MFRMRGMNPATFAKAYAAGCRSVPTPKHVFICVADHYEPDWNGANLNLQIARVDRWVREYPQVVDGCIDSRGRPPQHTFFYPIESYQAEHLEKLASLVRGGYGDVDVHLHHDDDNAESLRAILIESTNILADRHGLLRRDADGNLRYGFVHGNWALDNSHPDGRWCGVNDELSILRETGCYADFTMPAAPHPAQTRTINSIYYAVGNPNRCKSHDTGIQSQVRASAPENALLMIQGPLVISQDRLWKKPRVENGNISASQTLREDRMSNWLRAGVCVSGCPEWQFIKLHTHGAPEKNAQRWLGEAATRFHQDLASRSRRDGFQYYYVTAYEMAMLVHQAESGLHQPDFRSL